MEDGRRNDNMQILFSPGCEQPLRDNKFLIYELYTLMRKTKHLKHYKVTAKST